MRRATSFPLLDLLSNILKSTSPSPTRAIEQFQADRNKTLPLRLTSILFTESPCHTFLKEPGKDIQIRFSWDGNLLRKHVVVFVGFSHSVDIIGKYGDRVRSAGDGARSAVRADGNRCAGADGNRCARSPQMQY